MNIGIDLLKTPKEVLSTLCTKHGYPLIKIGSHQVCKVCAKENLEQTNREHKEELQQKLLQHRIHSSGLNQRYLECGFLIIVLVLLNSSKLSNAVRISHSNY